MLIWGVYSDATGQRWVEWFKDRETILDQTGALPNVKRHDYLPFGEELFAPSGNRTTAQGYTSGDAVRQQFTAKERDIETGFELHP